jgi:hypothetical protein
VAAAVGLFIAPSQFAYSVVWGLEQRIATPLFYFLFYFRPPDGHP